MDKLPAWPDPHELVDRARLYYFRTPTPCGLQRFERSLQWQPKPYKTVTEAAQEELAADLDKLALKCRPVLALNGALLGRIGKCLADMPPEDGNLLQALWEALPIFPEKMLEVRRGNR